MTLLRHTLEIGAHGEELTEENTSFSVGDGFFLVTQNAHYDTSKAFQGNKSVKISTDSFSGRLRWLTQFSTAGWWRGYLWIPSASTNRILQANTSGADTVAVEMVSDGTFRLRDGSGIIGSTTGTYATGQWIRIEAKLEVGSPGTLEFRFYNDPDSTTPTDTLSVSVTFADGTGLIDVMDFVSANETWFDEIAVSDVDWIGLVEEEDTSNPVDPALATHTISLGTGTADGDGNFSSVQPGDIVEIESGNRGTLNIDNFRGTPENPIIFVNDGGVVNITGSGYAGIEIRNCQYVRVTGSGVAGGAGRKVGYPYTPAEQDAGIVVDGPDRIYAVKEFADLLSEFGPGIIPVFVEVDHVEGSNHTQPAVMAADYDAADTNIVQGFNFHHCWIHDGAGVDSGEAFYIGKTNPSSSTGRAREIHVHHNLIERIIRDGIQITSCVDANEVHHNRIVDVGQSGESSHGMGVIVQDLSRADVYNNWIESSGRHGIYIRGEAGSRVFNNVVLTSGAQLTDGRGILVSDSQYGVVHPSGPTYVWNNTVVGSADHGIRVAGETELYNNISVDNGSLDISDGSTGSRVDNLTSDGTGQIANEDPGFVDDVNDDYHLEAGSAAIGAATSRSSEFFFDHDNVTRSSWDVGAFEFEVETAPPGQGIAFWQSEIDSLPTSGAGWSEFDTRTSSDAGTPDLTDQNSQTSRNVMLQALRWRMDGGGVGKSAIESKLLAFPGDEDVDSLGVFRQMFNIAIAAELIDMDIDTPTVTNAEAQTVTFREWLEEMMTKTVGDHSRWFSLRNTAVGYSGAEASYSNYGAYARASYMALAFYVGTTAQQNEAVASLRQMLGNYQGQDGFLATAAFDASWVNGSSFPATYGINPLSDGSPYSGLIYEDASRQTSEGGSAGPNFDPAPAQSWGVSYSLECWEALMTSAIIAAHNGHPDIYEEADSALDRAMDRLADEGDLNSTSYTRFTFRDNVRVWNKVYDAAYTEATAANNLRFFGNPEVMLAGTWPMEPTSTSPAADVAVDATFPVLEASADITMAGTSSVNIDAEFPALEVSAQINRNIPPGVSLSEVLIGSRELDFLNGSLRISHAVENRCSMRCNIESDVDLNLFEGEPIEILVNGARVFRGVMLKPKEVYPGPHNRIYSVEGTCFDYLAERRTMARAYLNTTVGDIVKNIISEFLASEGVTEGVIADGPNVTEALFSWIPVSQALDNLAERAGYWWHIEDDLTLNFGPPSTFAAPFDLDEIDEHSASVTKSKGNRDYRNRQYIRGGKAETEVRVESWKGDGDQRTFVTGFPLAKEPTITVNDQPATVDVKGIGDQNSEWFWARGSSEITQNTSDDPLGAADVLRVTYTGLIDFVAVSRDQAEIERRKGIEDFGSGVVDHVETDTSVTNTASAFEVAAGKLNRFATEGRSLQWTTEKTGLHSGQLITVNLPDIGFDGDQLLITSIEISNNAARLVHTVHAVEGPVDNNWAKWFGKAVKPLDPLFFRENIGENEVIIILADITENWGWSESQDEIIHACPVPSTSLNPSTTLFPC